MPDSVERWLPVKGYEGLYSVSDMGRVVSHNYNKTGVTKELRGTRANGYRQVKLSWKDKQKMFLVHRLVMAAFAGEPQEGDDVNHKSGIKADNSLSNLEYCSISENMLHAYANGLTIPAHGERHCCAKLTLKAIADIRVLKAAGMSQTSIAKRYGVYQSAISRILNGKRWVRALRENSTA